MCLPVAALAAIGLMAGGAGMNYFGDKKSDSAMYRTFSREQDRQKALEADQIQKFQDSLASTQGVLDPAAQDAAADRRNAALMGAVHGAGPSAGAYLPGAPSAAPVVNAHAVEAGKSADARTAGLAKALAILGGMGDQMQQNNINIGRNSQDIDQLHGFRSGSLDVLQSEMDAAKHKGDTLRGLGQLAQGIGQMMMAGGAGGAGGPLPVSVAGQTPLASMPVNWPAMPGMEI